ncbi:MAG TPA: allophanate hydrolase [Gemmataceae bacterium]|nr:allophanate hydrolase [Gemmataceae bacterium]
MPESSSISGLDLATLAHHYQGGAITPRQVISTIVRRIAAHPDPAVWIHLVPQEELLSQAETVEKRRARGEALPLFGIPFAIKDMIDVAGMPTTAGCPAFSTLAKRTAPVVTRLCEAGAILVGKTNLDQFATGLAGDRSPYGACSNVFDAAYISGGSSSGSGVAVAAGLVSFALGTDTAGSGRVPAGCNNIVGLKPTPGLLSTEHVVPACRSLDCVSIFALTVDDARTVCEIASGESWPVSTAAGDSALANCTFTTPRDEDLEFFGDDHQASLFHLALDRLEQMGARRVAVDFRPFREVAALLYEGPWVAERLAAVGEFLKQHGSDVLPVTRAIIEGGSRYSAVDLFNGQYRLRALRETCEKLLGQAEMMVVPTLPTIPTRAQVEADSMGWSRRLGYYTNFVNLLGLAGIVLPSGFTPHGLPASITLLGRGGSERRLCELGMAWQRRLDLPLGATGRHIDHQPEAPAKGFAGASGSCASPGSEMVVRVAVAGAHLRGQPLHQDLLRTGAHFVRSCHTAVRYRFVALLHLDPPRPGLLRDDERAGSILVEIYDLPVAGFGALVASVAPPLAIGTIELEDGEAVKGFLCESWAAALARDITSFGGWLAFRESLAQSPPADRKGGTRRRQRSSEKEHS